MLEFHKGLFLSKEIKKVFITGVSSGIGRQVAEDFLKKKYFVIGTCRNLASVDSLLKDSPNLFLPLIVDLEKNDEIEKISNLLIEHQIESIDILINNAGQAFAAPFAFQQPAEFQRIIQVNVLALMRITQILIPFLRKTKGRILQISSVSGVSGTPFLAAYCASKHAVEGFSESLRRELLHYDISVVVIGPGSVLTPIWDKGFSEIKSLYDKTDFYRPFFEFLRRGEFEKQNALHVEEVSELIIKVSECVKPKVRYSIVPNPFFHFLMSILPKAWVDCLYGKKLKMGNLQDQ